MKCCASRWAARTAIHPPWRPRCARALQRVLLELEALAPDELVARRDARLAAFGVYSESPP